VWLEGTNHNFFSGNTALNSAKLEANAALVARASGLWLKLHLLGQASAAAELQKEGAAYAAPARLELTGV
jgi:hypothetical protein